MDETIDIDELTVAETPVEEKKPEVMTPTQPLVIAHCQYVGTDSLLVAIGDRYVQPNEIVEAPKHIADYLLKRKDFKGELSAEEIAAAKKQRRVLRYQDLPPETAN